ncbi:MULTISPECIES: acyltransferase family protein [Francisella]|uniref:Acyltransferase n=2 Tax=Francisella TaxID=262 RepID=A0AAJ4TKQ1_9GAMM|nr:MULTISPECIES: acyltransferase [Francisella]QEO57416.1 acyltransferase [Francisella marina]QEO58467.1 acyltransferase [Francisella marina]QWU98909.1 acyltransferase [Francisella salimarina]
MQGIQNRLYFLDYLRVFAFISVLIGHKFYTEIFYMTSKYPAYHITEQYIINIINSLFYAGGAGVIVFFMISGYIILLVVNFERPVEFIIKRIFRIYPLLIVAILLQVILKYYVDNETISIKTVIIQMSLMGDFFNIPPALGGVEWTLRLEVMFYLLIAVVRILKINNSGYTLMLLFISICVLLRYILPVFPSGGWSSGYFSIYFPFLLLGSSIYLYEKNKINLLVMLFFTIFVFHSYFSMIYLYKSFYLNTNFAIVGYMVFMFMWLVREKLTASLLNNVILKVSVLTYSIYLFHDYLWDYIYSVMLHLNIDIKIFVVPILFVFCIIMNKAVENPMNKMGKMILKKYKD